MREFFRKKWVKRTLLFIIIVGIIMFLIMGKKENKVIRTDTAMRGDLEISISGNGALKASESRVELSKVSSKVDNVYYKEGDLVEVGYEILKLDSKDYEVNVNAQRIAIKQAELNKKNIENQIANLKIKAPTSGYISNLSLSENSFVNSNMPVCSIVASNKYEIKLQFVANDNNPIILGSAANIMLVNTMNYITGTVTFVGERKTSIDGGIQVIEVIISVEHSSYVLENVYAKADVQTINGTVVSSVNQNKFESVSGANVKTEVMGTVKKVYVKNGQYVNTGDIIADLENKDLILSRDTTTLSLQNSYEQLKYAESKLNDYKIMAPINGKITKLDLKNGDQVSLGTMLVTISDESTFEFQVPVDELDISRINYDSKVLVTIDAIPETEENPLVGKITKMPLQGVTTGGVTDYYITIAIEGREDLRISMNANAKVIIEKVEDVVYIPIEAINKKNGEVFVEVRLKDGTIEKRNVVTGISDISYIEIKEGLDEGEEIVVPELGTGFGFMMGG